MYKKKRALKLTSSANYLYDVVCNLLGRGRELVPILNHQAAEEKSDKKKTGRGR